MEGWLYCRKWCNCNLLTSWININHLASGIHSLPSLSWYSMKGNCYYPVFWITGWPISSVPSFVFSHNALISLLRRSYSLILIYYSIRTRLLYSFLGPTVIHSKQIREKRKLRSKFFSIGSQIRVSSGLSSQMRNYLRSKRRQTPKMIGY